MGYGYMYKGALMGGGWGPEYGILCFLTWVLIVIDLALLGVWLWQKIERNIDK